MSDTALSVRGVGKRYQLVHGRDRYGRLTESLSAAIRNPMRRGPKPEEFWALRDVTFDVPHGEVVGIVGRNGAGKSTLLKILSRITEPTTGEAVLQGRVGSLLEVGTGFHPELTGRENIYLSGSILGMRRAEIQRRFDEIVDFAEVERFLDTPVKRYSSGMQVRLGFAVAAHLEPDILIVDEVLAVGDAAFQKKSIGKMGAVATSGRTVLIVSHNLAVIDSLCRRALQLDQGQIVADGEASDVVRRYLEAEDTAGENDVSLADHDRRRPGMARYMQRIRTVDHQGRPVRTYAQGEPLVIEIDYDASAGPSQLAGAGFSIFTINGTRLAGFNSYMLASPPYRIPNQGTVRFTVTGPTFGPGRYTISPSIGTDPRVVADWIDHAIEIEVAARDIYDTGYLLTADEGLVALEGTFDVLADAPHAERAAMLEVS